MVMQIIPMRRIDATQAARDLATLIPASATLTANQDSNSLVVTDTNLNLKHIVTLVNALDTSSDTVSTMRVLQTAERRPNRNGRAADEPVLQRHACSRRQLPSAAAAVGSEGSPASREVISVGLAAAISAGAEAAMAAAAGAASRSGNQSTQRSTL
jgi:general secretion pathway protein D